MNSPIPTLEERQANFHNIKKWSDYFEALLLEHGYSSTGIARSDLEELLEEDSGVNPIELELYLNLIYDKDDYAFTSHFQALNYRVLLADARR